jgi:DNA-binding NtrC family response regulator
MNEVREQIDVAARSDEPVLILGETGTGKELVARWVHSKSSRGSRPLSVINCAAIPVDLVHSELFGHVAGSFTGARRSRAGKLRAATGSSVFLDEICSAPADLQAALLRTVEYGDLQPVGSDGQTSKADVRFIAATNKAASTLRCGELLRMDLLYRLAGTSIRVTPLRERKEDIPVLARHFLRRAARRYGVEKRLSASAMRACMEHDYPGNVRELRQLLLAAYARSPGDVIEELGTSNPLGPAIVSSPRHHAGTAPEFALYPIIREHIVRTLAEARGNVSRCARMLEIPRSTLQHHLTKYGIAADALRTD